MSRSWHDRSRSWDCLAAADVAPRTRLLEASVGLVEDVRSASTPAEAPEEGFSPEFQIALPYSGVLVWHVGGVDVVGDANQVLFVTGGESYRLSESLPGGYGELIITPQLDILAEIANAPEWRLPAHPLFRRRSRTADAPLQNLRARFLHWATGAADMDDLAAEELVLTLLRSALVDDAPRIELSASTRGLIRRTKEFLAVEFANPIRLGHIGRVVGASPTYLTDLFRRVEGVSLYRYVARLRLAHALIELPHADDLSTLALDVGFSSHSHFSAAFRRAYGCTPSQFRQDTRARQRPVLL